MRRTAATLLLLAGIMGTEASAQGVPSVQPGEWAAYQERFVRPEGRVVDDANGGISHSEGQGYGMLLAWMARDRAAFDRIWSFTRTALMLRDDGLAVWRWDPASRPPVTDPNNASDGDLLIAYALALAGEGWSEPSFTESATRIASALARTSLEERDGLVLLKPGVAGFGADDRPDGPVVNLSYWVFEAFPVVGRLVPDTDLAKAAADGAKLVKSARFSERGLPPDWLSLGRAPQPADGFPAEFGYNALRIPLYLMRAADTDAEVLRRLRDGMTSDDGAVLRVGLPGGQVQERLTDAGYRIIPALASCILEGTRVPDDLQRFAPTLYYPSTLHLLALAHAREARPQCL